MNVPRQAKQRPEQSRRRCMRYMIDGETTDMWAEKRARQARCREQLRSGDRSQGSCFFIHTEIACEMKVRHRSDEF